MLRFLFAVSFSALLGTSVGCGGQASDMPELGSVHGTITLNGQPLPNVTIYFKPDEGRQSIAKADAEGVYEAMYLIDEEGVKVGPNSVTVEWAIDDSGPSIPAKYGSDGTLKFDVQPDDNEFNIDMVSK